MVLKGTQGILICLVISAIFSTCSKHSFYFSPGQKDNRPTDKFQLTFPLRTNYMYAKVKKSLPEMYAFTICMWIKSNASPGVGTPFSYAVPGQANELVLIEWGNNPMEILINDKVSVTGICYLALELRCQYKCGRFSKM
uniref:Pentraxin (PTX) domain-containing protein n=1 Tax=Anolis carolinensis TaxID=28377 RepID=A0A803SQF6_ANOCA